MSVAPNGVRCSSLASASFISLLPASTNWSHSGTASRSTANSLTRSCGSRRSHDRLDRQQLSSRNKPVWLADVSTRITTSWTFAAVGTLLGRHTQSKIRLAGRLVEGGQPRAKCIGRRVGRPRGRREQPAQDKEQWQQIMTALGHSENSNHRSECERTPSLSRYRIARLAYTEGAQKSPVCTILSSASPFCHTKNANLGDPDKTGDAVTVPTDLRARSQIVQRTHPTSNTAIQPVRTDPRAARTSRSSSFLDRPSSRQPPTHAVDTRQSQWSACKR